jgi:hypothetical protein
MTTIRIEPEIRKALEILGIGQSEVFALGLSFLAPEIIKGLKEMIKDVEGEEERESLLQLIKTFQ